MDFIRWIRIYLLHSFFMDFIHWIRIYPLHSIICPLYNWFQSTLKLYGFFFFLKKHALWFVVNTMLTLSLVAIILIPVVHGYQFAAVYSEQNTSLQGHVIKSVSTSSLFHCMQSCDETHNCHSINLRDSQPKTCELNDGNHLTNPESMVNSSGFTYLNYFIHPVSKCSSSLCNDSSLECFVESDGINYECHIGK